jgi:protein TonB
MTTSSLTSQPHDYVLSSDLARICLPAKYQEATRKLAWVDSICLLFLVIGLIGFRVPRIEVKPIAPAEQVVPVVFVPQPEQPKPAVEPPPDEPPPDTQEIVDTPQVVTVVAANPADVAFAVPVEGAVMVAPARYATPPPPTLTVAPPKPTRFDPNAQSSGSYPMPQYPGIALRNGYQGTVEIQIEVDESGNVTAASVLKSSGYQVLDNAALKIVKERWRFPPGKPGTFIWPNKFELK